MTPPIHVSLAQHHKKRAGSIVSHNGDSTGDIEGQASIRLWWPTMSLFVYYFFVYNMSNMSLFCKSCIICLNEIYFICVLAQKLGSIRRGLWSS